MAEEKSIISIELNQEEFVKDAQKTAFEVNNLSRSITKLEENNKDLNAQLKALSVQQKAGVISGNEYRKNVSKISTEIETNKIKLSENKKERKNSIKVQQDESKSLNFLRGKLIKMKIERDKINISTKEGQKLFKEQSQSIKKLNTTIKKAEEAGGDYRRSVGGYSEAIKDSISNSEGLGGALEGVDKVMSLFSGGIVMKALAVTIGLIMFALSKFQPFIDQVSIAFAGMTSAIKPVLNIYKNLAFVIKDKLIVGFLNAKKGIIGLRILFNKLTGDSEGLKEAQEDLTENQKELTEAQEESKKSTDNLINSVENLGGAILKAFKEGSSIKVLELNLRDLEIQALKTNANLNKISVSQRIISDDATKSFKEREEALKKSAQAEEQILKNELDLAKKREEIARRQLAENKTSADLNRKFSEEYANRVIAETSLYQAQLTNEKEASELKQDRLEKNLDIELDIWDKRKSNIERQLGSDKLTNKEREKLLNEMTNNTEKSVVRQIEILQEFTDKKINLNDLLKTSNNQELVNKVRNLGLSEIVEGRLLEVMRERLTAQQDIADEEQVLSDKKIESVKQQEQEIHNLRQLGFEKEILKREQLLENEALTNELRLELLSELNELEKEKIQEHSLFLLENKQLTNSEIERIEWETNEKIKALDNDLATNKEEILKKEQVGRLEDTKNKINQAGAVAKKLMTIGQNLLNRQVENNRQEIASNQKKLEAGEISQQEFDDRKLKLDRDLKTKQHKLNVKKFRTDQALALTDIAIDTAKAVMKVVGQTGIGAAFLVPGIIAGGILQAAVVATKAPPPAPTFAKGGNVLNYGKFKGNSHDSGGIGLYLQNGRQIAEVEGGEAFAVVKKGGATESALDYINTSYGGNAITSSSKVMEEGGELDTTDTSSLNATDISVALANVELTVNLNNISDVAMERITLAVSDGVVNASRLNNNII